MCDRTVVRIQGHPCTSWLDTQRHRKAQQKRTDVHFEKESSHRRSLKNQRYGRANFPNMATVIETGGKTTLTRATPTKNASDLMEFGSSLQASSMLATGRTIGSAVSYINLDPLRGVYREILHLSTHFSYILIHFHKKVCFATSKHHEEASPQIAEDIRGAAAKRVESRTATSARTALKRA